MQLYNQTHFYLSINSDLLEISSIVVCECGCMHFVIVTDTQYSCSLRGTELISRERLIRDLLFQMWLSSDSDSGLLVYK